MKQETAAIISRIKNVHEGEPWFGRSVFDLLDEIDPDHFYTKPSSSSHSPADILYHMITWALFTKHRIEKSKETDLSSAEALDWRNIDPSIHTLSAGLKELRKTIAHIIALLETKDDNFLNDRVDYRDYDFRYLLHGFIDHSIYHAGQIALLNKQFI